MRRIVFLLCVFALVAASEFVQTKVPSNPKSPQEKSEPAPKPAPDFKETLLDLHNAERKQHGLGPLVDDQGMSQYAQKHADLMARKNILRHSSMSDLIKSCKGGSVAENIASGQVSEKEVVSDWMWSPGHRWNILGKSYKRAGFGMTKAEDGTVYWCAVFSN